MSEQSYEKLLRDYSNKICHHSRIAADAVKIYLSDLDESQQTQDEQDLYVQSEVLLEFIFLYLHISDRYMWSEGVARGAIRREQREKLMNFLEETCIESAVDFVFFGLEERAKRELKDTSFADFNRRQTEYAKCQKLFADRDEETKETVFWEFGKKITMLGRGGGDLGLLMVSMDLATKGVVDLNPKSLVEIASRI
ncbi:MAG: hypothetical protein ACYS8Z_02590 [Planctomycetota bacterium]|jgi:hypothetical protein